jgi:hypothetical protein
MLRRLQDRPAFLEKLYQLTYSLVAPLRGWLKPGSFLERPFTALERLSKQAMFDCRMCGMCVLHSTGMTCPMTCPKNMRNGPCGGVRSNGHCEIYPDRPCVWVQAWQRANTMPIYGHEIFHVQPPVNYRLQGSSAWINHLHNPQAISQPGWEE